MATWESRVYCNVNFQNTAENYSNVTIVFQIRRMDYSMIGWCDDGAANWRIICDGQDTRDVYFNFNWNYNPAGSWWTVATRSFDVGHAADGTKRLGFSAHYATGGISPPSFTASNEVVLTSIPRYTSITSFRIAGVTQTSATITWSTDASCDMLQYSKNNAAWAEATGNSFTVASLVPNTSYSFRIRVRRTDSGLWTESGTITASTLPIASISNATLSCNIGGTLSLSLINYNNNASLLELKAKNNSGVWVNIGSMTAPQGTASVAWNLSGLAASMYNLCPTSNALEIKVVCGISGTGYNGEKTGIAKVVLSNPAFSAFTFANTDTASSNILGSTAIMGTYIGNLRVTIPAANKAVAKNSATMSYYNVVVSSGSIVVANTITYAATDVIKDIGYFQTPGAYTIRVDAVDSRGNASSIVSKTMAVYPYHAPTIDVALDRLNSFDAEITMSLNAYISRLIVGSDKNAIQELKYRYKEVGGAFGTYKAITGYSSANHQATDKLHSLTKKTAPYLEVLDISKSYEFEFFIRDKIKTVTIARNIHQGKPIMNVLDNGKLLLNVVPSQENINDSKANIITDKDVKAGGKYILDEINQVSSNLSTLNGNLGKLSPLVKTLFLLIHPVGDVIFNTTGTNPGTLYGGTWTSWGAGRVPVGVDTSQGEFNSREKAGGSKTHTISISQVPNVSGYFTIHGSEHASPIYTTSGAFKSNSISPRYGNVGTGTDGATSVGSVGFNNGGGGQAHNNLQPYITCYMWKRTL